MGSAWQQWHPSSDARCVATLERNGYAVRLAQAEESVKGVYTPDNATRHDSVTPRPILTTHQDSLLVSLVDVSGQRTCSVFGGSRVRHIYYCYMLEVAGYGGELIGPGNKPIRIVSRPRRVDAAPVSVHNVYMQRRRRVALVMMAHDDPDTVPR